MATELFDGTSPAVHEVGTTARSTPRSSSDKSQSQNSTTRSAISSAASTSDTISSNEEVHNYEEWELGFDVEDGAKGFPNTDANLESSTDSNSQSPRCSPRSELESGNTTSDDAPFECEEEATEEYQNESHQDDGDQSVQEHPETARTFEESKSEIESARSTSESSSWAGERQASEDSVEHHQYFPSRSEDDSRGNLEILSQPVVVADPSTDAKDKVADRHTSSPDERLRDQSSKSVQGNIQVFVRVRPLPARHNESQDEAQVVKLGDDSNSIRVQAPSNHGANCVVTECSFDKVFMGSSTQEDVFSAVQPSIRASLDGYNATIFAYGQTGTGKTHTIFGEEADSNFLAVGKEDSENSPRSTNPTWGIIPRAMALLLDQAEALSSTDVAVSLQCSFMQIYNDRLFDLLTDRRRQRPLIIREQPTLEGGTNVVLQGLSSDRIATFDEALQVLRRGRANRSVRETELNSCSSRSHAIVQINITSERTLASGDKLIRKSRLNLVDLAGSEKWNTELEMEDAHSQELKNINTSLSALGNCIAALSEAGRRHIPYRDSTLTRLLQDSFGGNTQACLIATISPSVRACDETIRTLQFADRARSVMQFVRVNEALSGVSELQIAKAQISKLRERLESEQRRRHHTRVKEQEAAQKEFLGKLQVKEKEIQKLARDNAVFSRWREEDLRKIRELESRVKELEVVAQVDVNAGVSGSLGTDRPDDSASSEQAPLKRHDEKENLLTPMAKNDAAPPQAGIKKINSKKSISSVSSTIKKDDTAAIKPYRQILERYALGSKKSNRRQPERQPNETATTPPPASLSRNKQQAEAQVHAQAGVTTNDNNQRIRERDNQDAVPAPDGRREMASIVAYHGTSDVHIKRTSQDPLGIDHLVEKRFVSFQRFVNNNDASPIAGTSYASGWQPNAATSYSTPASYKNEDLAASAPSNWRSQTNLFDQAYRSYLHPSPSPLSNSEPDVKTDKLVETGCQYQRRSVPAASSVPASDKIGKSSTTRESSNFVVPFPTSSLASASSLGSSDACEKHSLKGCVLCAVRDTRSQTILPNKPSALASMANASAELSSSIARVKPVMDAARDGPCDRHHLASCFICGSSSGPTSLVQSAAVETRLSLINNPFQQVSSRDEEDSSCNPSAAAERNPLLTNDSKCDAHSLANCVLCAGVKAMTRKTQQGPPTRKAFPLDASTSGSNSAAAAWTSNRNLALADRSSAGEGSVAPSGSSFMRFDEQQQVSSPYSFNPATQQRSLLRRHSVDYGSHGDSEGSTSPVKLLVHLRPQQSAVNLHSTANDLASSNFPAPPMLSQPRIPGGAPHEATSTFSGHLPYLSNNTQSNGTAAAGNTPVQSSSSMKTNWQPAARPSIKEIAVDSNHKSYQALIREASDAAAFVLRRK